MRCQQIVIIEDEPDLRETLRDLLEISGFQVLTAENGKEGLRVAEELDAPCLILLDLMMPVMNGWEFLEAIRNNRHATLTSVPVVVISAAADTSDLQQRYGCLVLQKPFALDSLLAIATKYCAIAD